MKSSKQLISQFALPTCISVLSSVCSLDSPVSTSLAVVGEWKCRKGRVERKTGGGKVGKVRERRDMFYGVCDRDGYI